MSQMVLALAFYLDLEKPVNLFSICFPTAEFLFLMVVTGGTCMLPPKFVAQYQNHNKHSRNDSSK